jgi:phosphoribosylformylglycinamidine synthase
VYRSAKVLILRTGGTNCDVETEHAFRLAGADAERVHIGRFLSGERRLDEFHILVLPGGFSYGDDIAAGKLLANELVCRLREPLERFVADGKPILGICNGFQALVRAGLLPGLGGLGVQEATLTYNESGRFECRWVRLRPEPGPCVFTRGMEQVIELPIAHGEGRFFANPGVVSSIEANEQVVFRYTDTDGKPGRYPVNPNGSVNDIAGICSPGGTVLGMMPHPERFVRRLQHPRWTREVLPEEGHGLSIFRNAVDYARSHLL